MLNYFGLVALEKLTLTFLIKIFYFATEENQSFVIFFFAPSLCTFSFDLN